jgi:hypothetical protein
MTYDRTNRDEKTIALIKNDIRMMDEALAQGDTKTIHEFLSSILSGDGLVPYNQLDDDALDEAYYEMIDAGKAFLTCSICQENIEHRKQGSMIWADGNNAQPVNAGRCCDKCDCYIVIPTRLGLKPKGQHGKDMGDVMYQLRINPPTFPPQGDEQ